MGWYFCDKVGKINSIQGIDSLQNIKNYQGCIIRRKEGSIISSVRDNTAIIGFIFASGGSHSELEESLNDIKKNIYIDIESDSVDHEENIVSFRGRFRSIIYDKDSPKNGLKSNSHRYRFKCTRFY